MGAIVFGVFAIGIVAAITLPGFFKFQARSKQTECKQNLKEAFWAQRALLEEGGSYATELTSLDWEPERGNRYAYLFAPQGDLIDRATTAALGGAVGILPDSANHSDRELSPERVRAAAAVAAPGISGTCPQCSVTIACVGNVDWDGTLDVWSISTVERTMPDGQVIAAGEFFAHVDDVAD